MFAVLVLVESPHWTWSRVLILTCLCAFWYLPVCVRSDLYLCVRIIFTCLCTLWFFLPVRVLVFLTVYVLFEFTLIVYLHLDFYLSACDWFLPVCIWFLLVCVSFIFYLSLCVLIVLLVCLRFAFYLSVCVLSLPCLCSF